MKQVKGWWLPDYDRHFDSHLKKVDDEFVYQKEHRDFALSFVDNFDFAIDVGSNVGFWSKDLCKKFRTVWGFEPISDVIECYRENMEDFDNWHLEEVGLSNKQGENVPIYKGLKNSGGASLVEGYQSASNEVEYITVKLLDDYREKFDSIDFIKVDIQGHEYEFLTGALECLDYFNPVLSLELPLRTPEEREYANKCKGFLSKLAYKEVGKYKKDTVFKR